MDLHPTPLDLKIEFLFQLFDDALADVAEGSDVIGKDLHADGHERPLFQKNFVTIQVSHKRMQRAQKTQ
jgi:hypothetical protein